MRNYKKTNKLLYLLLPWLIVIYLTSREWPTESYQTGNATERFNVLEKDVTQLLLQLNADTGNKVETYQHILPDQLRSYLLEVESFQSKFPVRQICEIGFFDGKSSAIFLKSVNNTGVSYFGIDMSPDRDSALKTRSMTWLRKTFPGTHLTLVKGEPTHIIPSTTNLKCDIIHINNATRFTLNFLPIHLYQFLAKFAAKSNLLLIDSCLQSVPRPMVPLSDVINNGMVSYPDTSALHYMVGNRENRDPKHGWCVGSYQKDQFSPPLTSRLKVTVVLMGYTTTLVQSYNTILSYYSTLDQYIDKIICIMNEKEKQLQLNLPKSASVPVKFIHSPNINLRQLNSVLHQIQTDPVLVIDNSVLLNKTGFAQLLNIWDINRDRLIGLDRRAATWIGGYFKPKHPQQPTTIVSGKTMLFHRKYLRLYLSSDKLLEFNENRFCDHITLSAVINSYTGANPLVLDNSSSVRVLLEDYNEFISDIENWGKVKERTECVQLMERYYHLNVFRYGYGDNVFIKWIYRAFST